MRIDFIRYDPHTLSLRPFKFFSQQLPLLFAAVKLFHKVIYENEQSIKLRPVSTKH